MNKSLFQTRDHEEDPGPGSSQKNVSYNQLLNSVRGLLDRESIGPNKTVLSNVSGKTTDENKILPYAKSIKILREMTTITSLTKKKMLFNYVWNKIQKEVFTYWKGKEDIVKPQKLKMYEDTRLCVMAYVIVMSECADVFIAFKALSPFID